MFVLTAFELINQEKDEYRIIPVLKEKLQPFSLCFISEKDKFDTTMDPNNPKFEAFQNAVRDALAKRLRDADEELAR